MRYDCGGGDRRSDQGSSGARGLQRPDAVLDLREVSAAVAGLLDAGSLVKPPSARELRTKRSKL